MKKLSERVPNKNIRTIGRFDFGLLEIKLRQLIACPLLDAIIVSTDIPGLNGFIDELGSERLSLHARPSNLAQPESRIEELAQYAATLTSHTHVLWTHVTSPFITSRDYSRVIEEYFRSCESDHDSLATVDHVRKYARFNNVALNYGEAGMEWPPTQELEPVVILDSGVFVSPRDTLKIGKRLGKNPHFFSLGGGLRSFDIDYEEDFTLAKLIIESFPTSTGLQ